MLSDLLTTSTTSAKRAIDRSADTTFCCQQDHARPTSHKNVEFPVLPQSTLAGVTTLDDYEDAAPSRRKRPRREASVAAKLALRQPSPLDLSPPFRPTGAGTGGGSQANRKVSHSLIERRRREKINQCLATLSEVVPQNQEERERKDIKAKERGRKRGRKGEDGDEDGQRNGLHKLEVLEVRLPSPT